MMARDAVPLDLRGPPVAPISVLNASSWPRAIRLVDQTGNWLTWISRWPQRGPRRVGFRHNTEPAHVTRKSAPCQFVSGARVCWRRQAGGLSGRHAAEAVGQPAEMGDQEGGGHRHQQAARTICSVRVRICVIS
jgi:hypothetical protein